MISYIALIGTLQNSGFWLVPGTTTVHLGLKGATVSLLWGVCMDYIVPGTLWQRA